MKLKYSTLIFNIEKHRYITREGRELLGITGLLSRQLFAGKYDGIPREILNRAAEHGSFVHREINDFITLGFTPKTPEAQEAIKEFNPDTCAASEYLVSDGENYATMIDFMDKEFNLYDFKTTAVLDKEYVSWQLSISAYLFKCQNGFEPKNFYAVHLRGDKMDVKPVEKKSEEEVLELLACDLAGENYLEKKSAPVKADLPLVQVKQLESTILEIESELKYFTDLREELFRQIYDKMEEKNLKKIETDELIITRVLPSESVSIDTKKLKEELPEIAKKYEKISQRKGYVKLTIKK